jgi:serine/threonine-protein kinase
MTAIEIPTPDPRSLDDATRPFAEAIAERYAIKRLIGRGGMGMVYLARDKRLDRLVAIKTLPPHLATDVAIQERFLRETRTAGAMAHPNIVPIHGADEIDQHVFFVMAYVDGESLATRIRVRGTLDATTAARHLRDVAAALAHAHERGIIHRDIKAENILIERSSDRALVTDFGIARLAEASPLTVTGQVLGTVHYVSPEQVSGGQVDARSDIYSLGVVGYLALAGRFPFDAEVASAVLLQHVTKAPAPIATVARGVPASLATIIDRCLAKDPAHRFATASELHDALDAAIPTLGQASPGAPLISDTEAHQVWHRAAELQALTGIEPRPELPPRERDAQLDLARKQGFALEQVRSAATEAGIGEKYVERAFVEHGLVQRTPVPGTPVTQTPRAIVEPPVERNSWWAGAPPFIAREVVVEGELPTRDLDRLINVLRDATGSMGHTMAHTRELAWWTGRFGTRVDVSVVPESDRTTVRVVQDARRSMRLRAAAALGTGFFAGLFTGVFLAEGIGMFEPLAVLGAFAAGLTWAIKGGRWFIRRGNAQIATETSALTQRLAAKVKDSVKP